MYRPGIASAEINKSPLGYVGDYTARQKLALKKRLSSQTTEVVRD